MSWSKKMQEKQRNRVEALYEFAMRLQACAERAGLTQAEVRTRMGAKRYYVRNWFRGKCFPRGDAAKLAEILSVSVEFLLHGNGAELPGVGELADAGQPGSQAAQPASPDPVQSDAISSTKPATLDRAALHAKLDRLIDSVVVSLGGQIEVHLVFPRRAEGPQ